MGRCLFLNYIDKKIIDRYIAGCYDIINMIKRDNRLC